MSNFGPRSRFAELVGGDRLLPPEPVTLLSALTAEESAGGSQAEEPRVSFAAVDVTGRTVEIQFKIRLETVELWVGEHNTAVIDRLALRAWLADPSSVGPLVIDEVRLELDRVIDQDGRIAVWTFMIHGWALHPTTAAHLTERV
jgi:hypothetical protein